VTGQALGQSCRLLLCRQAPSSSLRALRRSGEAGTGCAAPGQADCELGELAEHAVDFDRSSMLLCHDVIADREAETRPLAGRFGRKERLEQLVAQFWRNSGAVVAHPDLDLLTEVAGHDLERRAKAVHRLAAPLGRGIKAVAKEVQEHPGHVLWYQLD